jgi:metal-responsive CopG/Arc/MetJ family transcriptional regulator
MSARTERLIFHLAKELLTKIEEFQFNNRLPSRAAAIRELLKRGLESHGRDQSTDRSRL